MTQQEFIDFSNWFHAAAHDITKVKNTDYSPGDNPFSNFEKLSPLFGADWPIKMLVARLHEKLDRITNYALHGKNPNNSEDEANDFIDLANYSAILLAYLKSKKC
jgi:hypothetical protein